MRSKVFFYPLATVFDAEFFGFLLAVEVGRLDEAPHGLIAYFVIDGGKKHPTAVLLIQGSSGEY